MTQLRAQDKVGDYLIAKEIELFQNLQQSRKEAAFEAKEIFSQFKPMSGGKEQYADPSLNQLNTSINQMQTAGNELASALAFLQRNAALMTRLVSNTPAKDKKAVSDSFAESKKEFEQCVQKFSIAAINSSHLIIQIEDKLNPQGLKESQQAVAEMAKKGKDQPLFEPLAPLPGIVSGFSHEFKIEKKPDDSGPHIGFTKVI